MKTIDQTHSLIATAKNRWLHFEYQLFRRILKSAALLVAISELTGCMPCYYAPSSQNVPLFQEKNQFRGSGSFKNGSYTIGCDFQGALAVTDHLGLTANYSHFKGKGSFTENEDDDWTDISKGNTFEFGMGYYLPFKKLFVFETYAGYGRSKVTSDFEEYGYGSTIVHSSSFFLQPAIGLHINNHVELAFSTRFRLLKFDEGDFYPWMEYDPDYGHNINKPLYCFLEPAFTGRFGGENVKFQFQVSISHLLGQSKYLDYDPFNLNLGLIFTIHGKKKADR